MLAVVEHKIELFYSYPDIFKWIEDLVKASINEC